MSTKTLHSDRASEVTDDLLTNTGDRFHPWVREIPCRKKWRPTAVFLPGESTWTEELGGPSPSGCKKSRYD